VAEEDSKGERGGRGDKVVERKREEGGGSEEITKAIRGGGIGQGQQDGKHREERGKREKRPGEERWGTEKGIKGGVARAGEQRRRKES